MTDSASPLSTDSAPSTPVANAPDEAPAKIVQVLMHEVVKDALASIVAARGLRVERTPAFDEGEIEAWAIVPPPYQPVTGESPATEMTTPGRVLSPTYRVVLDEIQRHHYDERSRGGKPDDPGWHPCSCGWEGYWSAFEPHVAERVTAALTPEHKIHTWERSQYVASFYKCLVCGLTTHEEPAVWVEPLTAPASSLGRQSPSSAQEVDQ